MEEETAVVCPIFCHDRITQQHSGEEESQLAMLAFADFVPFPDFVPCWASTPTINAERANAKIEPLRDEEIIVYIF